MSAFVTPVLSAQSAIFNGPRNYPAGYDRITVADFNGDGLPDLAEAGKNTNTVSVLLQNPDGTFQAAVNYTVGNQPYSVLAGDINGDGKQDLVVVDSGDNTLGVLLGNGDGTFQAQVTTALPVTAPSGNSYPFLVLGDWNGDGKTDVAVAGASAQVGSNSIAAMLSNGDGTFQAPVTYSLPAAAFALNAADINSDGKLDLVTADGTTGVSVWLGNGDGTFRAAVTTNASQPIWQPLLVIADFNQDGHLDIATATLGFVDGLTSVPNLTLFLGNGDGTFQPDIISSLQYFPYAAGDLNGDGKLDLIAGPGTTTATVLLNSGNATFTVGPSFDLWPGGVPSAITLSDLNGDQKLDLVTGGLSVLYGDGDGTFAQFPLYGATTSQTAGSIMAADFNNDGKPDLATAFVGPAGYLNIGVLFNNGAGLSAPIDTSIKLVNQAPTYIAAGDFNNDGQIDAAIAIGYPSSGVFVLLNKGSGAFQTAVEYGQQVTGPLAVGDFNGDGKLDILGVSATNPGAAASVLLGNGDGTFGFPLNTITTVTGNGVVAQAMAVGDFNGDGKLDVAALVSNGAAPVTLQLLILLGNGDGTFTVGPTYDAGANPVSITTGDLNGDGKTDIVVGNAAPFVTVGNPEVAVLLGNGDGTFQAPITTTAGNGNYSVAVADFNLDGKTDVILSDGYWSDISLLLGNGDGTFQPPMQFFLGNSLGVFTTGLDMFAVADFDGNGAPDLAVSGSNGVSLLLNASGSQAASPLLSTGTLAFGSVHMGQSSSPQTATLTNTATTALTITGITISGAQGGDFSQTNSCGTTLATGATCTITVLFTPLASGGRAAAIQITDSGTNSPQIINLGGTGGAPPAIGFGLATGSPSSETATNGSAGYTFTIGGAGMSGTATLTCTGAPQGANCGLPQQGIATGTIPVSATTAANFVVEVTITSRTAPADSRSVIGFGGMLAAVLLGIVLVPMGRGKRNARGLYLSVIFASLLLISSCGGGSSAATTNPKGTPAGTYNLTVTATMNSTTQTVTLILIVQ